MGVKRDITRSLEECVCYLVRVVHSHTNTSAFVIVYDPLFGLASILGCKGHLEATGAFCYEISGSVLYKVSRASDKGKNKIDSRLDQSKKVSLMNIDHRSAPFPP